MAQTKAFLSFLSFRFTSIFLFFLFLLFFLFFFCFSWWTRWIHFRKTKVESARWKLKVNSEIWPSWLTIFFFFFRSFAFSFGEHGEFILEKLRLEVSKVKLKVNSNIWSPWLIFFFFCCSFLFFFLESLSHSSIR